MLPADFALHPFFALDHAESWVKLNPFMSYITQYLGHSRSLSTSIGGSRFSSVSLSRSGTPFSTLPAIPHLQPDTIMTTSSSESLTRFSSPSIFDDTTENGQSHDPRVAVQWKRARTLSSDVETVDTTSTEATAYRQLVAKKPSRKKTKKRPDAVKITHKLFVDRIETLTSIPPTWTVPRNNVAYLLELADEELLTTKAGSPQSIDAFIRSEVRPLPFHSCISCLQNVMQDQESWGGSSGHSKGDGFVFGLTAGTVGTQCRRAHLTCNGINTCEFFDEDLFRTCERYEPDDDAMRDLWNLELDANDKEASSVVAVISR
jgi:hypothetical protein